MQPRTASFPRDMVVSIHSERTNVVCPSQRDSDSCPRADAYARWSAYAATASPTTTTAPAIRIHLLAAAAIGTYRIESIFAFRRLACVAPLGSESITFCSARLA